MTSMDTILDELAADFLKLDTLPDGIGAELEAELNRRLDQLKATAIERLSARIPAGAPHRARHLAVIRRECSRMVANARASLKENLKAVRG